MFNLKLTGLDWINYDKDFMEKSRMALILGASFQGILSWSIQHYHITSSLLFNLP